MVTSKHTPKRLTVDQLFRARIVAQKIRDHALIAEYNREAKGHPTPSVLPFYTELIGRDFRELADILGFSVVEGLGW